ncbi:TrkH family potassium uptake protein [Tropicibacter oceani]|uniref:Potassium transporter TrkG n=1 Tax=Tropicibacter oceani TaxID=3058420 RepID=A0ABY8QF18_9RHOB|nr:potassium transporter TrkG [Tropicibacter oceani]WGW03115.1 potassium transporter TrkG [Tropicibacter oceani]
MTAIARLPLFLMLLGLMSVTLIVPAGYALAIEEFHDARAFFYSGLVGMILTALVGIALSNRAHNLSGVRQLLGFLAAFIFLPIFLAVPFYEAVRTTTFLSAYVEMVSALTTTGASLFDPARLSGPEHLWRGLVGWMGGLMVWVAASAILAPLTLGGFEVTAGGEPGQLIANGAARDVRNTPARRLHRSAEALVPIYVGLTLALCVLLLVAGDPPLVALMHAMAVMSTSGITPLAGVTAAPSGLIGEMILFCFMFFALSRMTFSTDTGQAQRRGLQYDPEFRLGLLIVGTVPVLFFVRHWLASFEVGDEQNLLAGVRAFWGGLFTAMSFLSTTGFLSGDWDTAQAWSGLSTPGILLMGLAMVGGGVATTAGGVKLLRVYALYLNGKRELERLIHPHSVGGSGLVNRRIRREGAFIAWVFFMLFAVTLAGFCMAFSAVGIGFEQAMILTVAGLSNTGPLVLYSGAEPIVLNALGAEAKALLSAAMILGRLELLAIVVMLSPDLWRS